MTYIVYGMITFAVIILAYYVIFILRASERGVVFFLGRFQSVMGPGIIVLIPGVQQLVRVDLRTRVLDVPTQDVISRDNVSAKVDAVINFKVFDPEKSIVHVEDFQAATSELAQKTLCSVLSQHEADEMISERDKLNSDIQQTLDKQTDAWGIKVANVEIKQVDLDETMVRAIAKKAERKRRAKVIAGEGEYQTSEKLTAAAMVLAAKKRKEKEKDVDDGES